MRCKLGTQAGVVLVFSILCFLLRAAPTHADEIATVDLNASFIDGTFSMNQSLDNGPSFYLTGQFTLDESTAAIGSWNMTFLGPLGATYQLSSQNGGVASAGCEGSPPCPYPGPGGTSAFWDFSFGNSGTSTRMDTLFGSATPFYAGESLQLCPLQNTYYDNGVSVPSPGCSFTSSGSFDSQTGYLYSFTNGQSSGILTVSSVISTPEPAESAMLLLGIAILFGMHRLSRPPFSTAHPPLRDCRSTHRSGG